jgi:hypothetical protein
MTVIIDMTQSKYYKQTMMTLIKKHQKRLKEMGFDIANPSDEDFRTMCYLVRTWD